MVLKLLPKNDLKCLWLHTKDIPVNLCLFPEHKCGCRFFILAPRGATSSRLRNKKSAPDSGCHTFRQKHFISVCMLLYKGHAERLLCQTGCMIACFISINGQCIYLFVVYLTTLFSNYGHIASNERMINKRWIERFWIKRLFQHLPGGTEENHKPQSR
jgi:hypothetical protein